jgi:hypothetical protein
MDLPFQGKIPFLLEALKYDKMVLYCFGLASKQFCPRPFPTIEERINFGWNYTFNGSSRWVSIEAKNRRYIDAEEYSDNFMKTVDACGTFNNGKLLRAIIHLYDPARSIILREFAQRGCDFPLLMRQCSDYGYLLNNFHYTKGKGIEPNEITAMAAYKHGIISSELFCTLVLKVDSPVMIVVPVIIYVLDDVELVKALVDSDEYKYDFILAIRIAIKYRSVNILKFLLCKINHAKLDIIKRGWEARNTWLSKHIPGYSRCLRRHYIKKDNLDKLQQVYSIIEQPVPPSTFESDFIYAGKLESIVCLRYLKNKVSRDMVNKVCKYALVNLREETYEYLMHIEFYSYPGDPIMDILSGKMCLRKKNLDYVINKLIALGYTSYEGFNVAVKKQLHDVVEVLLPTLTHGKGALMKALHYATHDVYLRVGDQIGWWVK